MHSRPIRNIKGNVAALLQKLFEDDASPELAANQKESNLVCPTPSSRSSLRVGREMHSDHSMHTLAPRATIKELLHHTLLSGKALCLADFPFVLRDSWIVPKLVNVNPALILDSSLSSHSVVPRIRYVLLELKGRISSVISFPCLEQSNQSIKSFDNLLFAKCQSV